MTYTVFYLIGVCSGIPYLLVVTTPIDVYLLGVTFGDVNSTGTYIIIFNIRFLYA